MATFAAQVRTAPACLCLLLHPAGLLQPGPCLPRGCVCARACLCEHWTRLNTPMNTSENLWVSMCACACVCVRARTCVYMHARVDLQCGGCAVDFATRRVPHASLLTARPSRRAVHSVRRHGSRRSELADGRREDRPPQRVARGGPRVLILPKSHCKQHQGLLTCHA